MDFKQIILDSLEVLRKKEVAEKAVFKARAYAKVIQQIRDRPGKIGSFADLAGISGIGEKIQVKIQEIFETGALGAAERARQTYNLDALDLFQSIYGVGPTKAEELVRAGFKTIEDLRDNPTLLNDKQRIGLQYYEALLERIPRAEMDKHARKIALFIRDTATPYPAFGKEGLNPRAAGVTFEITGSYRRGAMDSGDIDVLIRYGNDDDVNLKNLVRKMKSEGYLLEVLAEGSKRVLAICSVGTFPRRIDIILIPEEQYAYQLLYFTGSAKFNIAMRLWATDRGYSLKEFGLFPERPGIPYPPLLESEEEVFAFLGLQWVAPTDRVDHRQIQPLL